MVDDETTKDVCIIILPLRSVFSVENEKNRRPKCFTSSRGTKQLADGLEDQDVSAATGQAVCVEEANDEGRNERSNTRTC